MLEIVLFLAGALAYTLSTLSGGGGAILLLPFMGLFLPASQIAPVVNLGNMIGRPARIILFWKHIEWKLVAYYCPSAFIGAFLGALIFVQLSAQYLQIILGIFLIYSAFKFKWGKKNKTFNVKAWHFIPLGAIVSFISTVFGATGAILNPFLLNYGLVKEKLIATKTMNSFLVGFVQIGSYAYLDSLNNKLWLYGIFIGLGAIFGNIAGKILLKRISEIQFRTLIILIMFISGISFLMKSI